MGEQPPFEPICHPLVDDAQTEFARVARELMAAIHAKMIADQQGEAFEDLETIAL